MLALGRPPLASHFGMSSNQLPGKDDNVFGYTFPGGHIDHAAAAENITAAGPPLLTDLQYNHLQTFFDQGPFNFDPSIPFPDPDLPNGSHNTHDFGFNSFFDPPPTFHGASAVADPSQTSHIFAGLDQHPGVGYVVPSAEDHVAVSDDVIGAATALLATTQGPPDLTYDGKPHWTASGLVGLPSPANSYSTGGDQRGMTVATSLSESTSPMLTQQMLAHHGQPDSSLASIFFASGHAAQNQRIQNAPPHSRPPTLPRFGSDSNFRGNGYISASRGDTEEAVMSRLYKDMQVLEPTHITESLPNTQPSSPTQKRSRQTPPDKKRTRMSPPCERRFPLPMRPEPTPAQSDDDETSSEDMSPGAKPSKRRKTLTEADRGRTGSEASTSAHRTSSFSATRARKPRTSVAETTPRKKSSSAAQKAQRENLTEEQKRNNHILSEQKRRNLIKQGFEEMNELVPGLKSGGFSKSSVLMEGAKFLETLVRGNEILRQALGEV